MIAHLSDFHLRTGKPGTSLIRANIADAIRRIVADLAAFTPTIDAVMLTGDLTDGGTKADYAFLRELLAAVGKNSRGAWQPRFAQQLSPGVQRHPVF